jgi:DNA-binding NtrC family response regulator
MKDREVQLRLAAAGYAQKKRTRRERKTMAEIKLAAVLEAVSAFGGHRGKAANRLKISEASLYRYLKKMKANNAASEGEEELATGD